MSRDCSTCRHHQTEKCLAPQNIDWIDADTGKIAYHWIFCTTHRKNGPSIRTSCGEEGAWWAPQQEPKTFFARVWGRMRRQ